MRRLWAGLCAASISLAALTACREAIAEPILRPVRTGDIAIAQDSEVFRSAIPDDSTFAALLADLKVSDHESLALITVINEQFDLRRLRAGQPYRLDRYLDGRVREFEYEIDNDRRLKVTRTPDAFVATLTEILKERAVVAIEGRVRATHDFDVLLRHRPPSIPLEERRLSSLLVALPTASVWVLLRPPAPPSAGPFRRGGWRPARTVKRRAGSTRTGRHQPGAARTSARPRRVRARRAQVRPRAERVRST